MSKQLVLFFTSDDVDWDWIPGHSGKKFHPVPKPTERPETSGCALVILEDQHQSSFRSGEDENSSDAIDHLKKAESWADEIYIALHERTSFRQDNLISHNKVTPRGYHHEPERDRIYGAFKDVVESCKESGTTSERTQKTLGELVDAFDTNWLLEAKLEILHRCLTSEGAKTVLSKDFPDKYPKRSLLQEKLDGSPINGENTMWHVRHVVNALANEVPEDEKEQWGIPDDKRQHALTMMRDALLRDE